VTALPAHSIARAHHPVGEYETFRACARWEFAFHCAFCWLHESDLCESGIERTGLTWLEHLIPRSEDDSRADDYGNVAYSCRFCNASRARRRVVDAQGRRLLDPCTTAWAVRFRREQWRLVPATGDPDADYTHEAYNLDDPRKRELRAARGRIIEEANDVLRDVPGLLSQLAGNAIPDAIQLAATLGDVLDRAKRDLRRYRAVPQDAPGRCRCGHENTLPTFVAIQCSEV